MKKERRKQVYMLFSILITLLLISTVSAGFWDKLTGKVSYTRDLTLTVQAAPQIVYVSDIIGGDRTLNLAGSPQAQKEFQFYVYHSGGLDVLPGDAGPAIDLSNVLLTVKLQGASYPEDMRISSDVGVCSWIGNDLSYNTNGDMDSTGSDIVDIGIVEVKKYSCIVEMQYYDDYGSAGLENWDVEPFIIDSFSKEEGYNPSTDTTTQNGLPQPDRNTYFDFLDGSDVTGAAPLDFGIIDYTAPLNREPINAPYPLQVINTGNKNLNPIEITGYDIPGVTTSTEYIRASWFRVDTLSSVCSTGNTLVDTAPEGPAPAPDLIESGLSPIDDGSDASPNAFKDLRICLTSITTAASPQDYATTPLIDSWVIDVTYAA